jgi:flavin-binding protein dodecin
MCPRDDKQEQVMSDHVYKIVELVGSSETSIEDAIQTAIRRASQTLRNLQWFEVVQTRGHIENGEVRHYQVALKAGFTLDDGAP